MANQYEVLRYIVQQAQLEQLSEQRSLCFNTATEQVCLTITPIEEEDVLVTQGFLSDILAPAAIAIGRSLISKFGGAERLLKTILNLARRLGIVTDTTTVDTTKITSISNIQGLIEQLLAQ